MTDEFKYAFAAHTTMCINHLAEVIACRSLELFCDVARRRKCCFLHQIFHKGFVQSLGGRLEQCPKSRGRFDHCAKSRGGKAPVNGGVWRRLLSVGWRVASAEPIGRLGTGARASSSCWFWWVDSHSQNQHVGQVVHGQVWRGRVGWTDLEQAYSSARREGVVAGVVHYLVYL